MTEPELIIRIFCQIVGHVTIFGGFNILSFSVYQMYVLPLNMVQYDEL